MKIIDKINKANDENRTFWSFEYFTPKTEMGVQNLYDRMERMQRLGPEFIDITLGGTSADLTMDLVSTAQSVYGLETMMHLTCTNMSVEKINTALKAAKACGCRNILALRGDLPKGQPNWESCENEFRHAIDLVRYIRKNHGDYFCIAVAGHPEGHLNSESKEKDLQRLKEKVDAGADLIITQLFFDVSIFIQFVKDCRALGITCPILPGIFPIQSHAGLKRLISFTNNYVPPKIWEDLEAIKDDDLAVKDYGIELALQHIRTIQQELVGMNGFHIYTLNLERSSHILLEKLGVVPEQEDVKPLPWHPSLGPNRANETVRPIFWKNRTQSYIQRTEAWDEFPNGRWGDARSPAFGEFDRWGVSIKYSMQKRLAMWGEPQSVDDIALLFAKYCKGKIEGLPWSAQKLEPETDTIKQRLAAINLLGYLTINSQPAVNGAKSNDPVYGWGPKNGYVYQKAYLEFFVPPEKFKDLVQKISQDPEVTYFAGDLKTNTCDDEPNAVTWGVFPGKEIIQPTIVEPVAFMAWKDEAFSLWQEWARTYDRQSVSAQTILDIYENWYLVNIVHNDFQDGNGIWRLFDLEIDGDLARKLRRNSGSFQVTRK